MDSVRLVQCAVARCGRTFFLCPGCDRGHIFCEDCRPAARLADVRLDAGLQHVENIHVCDVLAEVEIGASFMCKKRGLRFEVTTVDPTVVVRARVRRPSPPGIARAF